MTPAWAMTMAKHRRGMRLIPQKSLRLRWWEGKKTSKRWNLNINRKQEQVVKERLEVEDTQLNDSICGHLQLNILQIL